MGISHFEDLTPSQFSVVAGNINSLNVSNKIDGSFLAAGYDEHMRFYTERKGGQRFYDISEWPVEAWSSGFRQAHLALESWFEIRRAVGEVGRYSRITCDFVWGYQPNVVNYTQGNRIWLHGSDTNPLTSVYSDLLVKTRVIKSDGLTSWTEFQKTTWTVHIASSRTINFNTYAADLGLIPMQAVEDWLDGASRVIPYTRRAILEFKLNRRPEGVSAEAWRISKPLIKAEREILQQKYHLDLTVIRHILLDRLHRYHMSPSCRGLAEGYVVSCEDVTFKLIYREWFAPANQFLHWVQYALIGGRRPARPSFESRTRHWPLERRLKRLDVLLDRYKRYHEDLDRTFTGFNTSSRVQYSDEVHDRVLNLFYDFRQRLINGRTGLQRTNPANSLRRDPSHSDLVVSESQKLSNSQSAA